MVHIENKAIWLNPDGSLTAKNLLEPRKPGKGEALVEVLYSGINPADTKHARIGSHSTVAGYDFFGMVKDTGSECIYTVGEAIAGFTPTGFGRPEHYGSHQNFIVYPDDKLAWRVPSTMNGEDAACLTAVTRAAADALFNLMGLTLPGEKPEAVEQSQGPLLIWGGSTSLGIATIQFAKNIGISPIVVTASPHQHQLLIDLGATKCFDYKDENVVNSIREYFQQSGLRLMRVFDAVGNAQIGTADLAASCGETDAKVLCATMHPKYPMPAATTETDMVLEIRGSGRMTIPARRKDAERAQKALLWAVEHYGTHFRLPKVTVISGRRDEAMEAITAVGRGKAGFGKFVIAHPLYD